MNIYIYIKTAAILNGLQFRFISVPNWHRIDALARIKQHEAVCVAGHTNRQKPVEPKEQKRRIGTGTNRLNHESRTGASRISHKPAGTGTGKNQLDRPERVLCVGKGSMNRPKMAEPNYHDSPSGMCQVS